MGEQKQCVLCVSLITDGSDLGHSCAHIHKRMFEASFATLLSGLTVHVLFYLGMGGNAKWYLETLWIKTEF